MGAPTAQDEATVLTAAGRARVQERLDRARSTAARLARGADALSADEQAEREMALRQVQELTALLARASTVDSVDEDPTIVEVGDEVDVEDEDGDLDTYALVHPVEARADESRISVASPLGRALLGARPGDRVRVDAPAGPYWCTVRARRRLT